MASDPWKAIEPSKQLAWYIPSLDKKVTLDVRQLLEIYSKVPPADVLQHVHNIRDKAWAIRPYPCTGLGSFLTPMITKSPAYLTIISRLQSGDSFLDVGCYLGQDLRRLVFDGAPPDHLYAVDIVSHWELGYELFRDADKFTAKFIEANILHPNAELQALAGKIDTVSVTHVLHQWDWEGQVAAAKQLNRLSRPGGLVVGFQVGTAGGVSKKVQRESNNMHSWMRQGPETWREMWALVGQATGTEWEVKDTELKTWGELGFDPQETAYLGEDARLLQFVVARIR